MTEPIIRDATPEDLDAVREVVAAAYGRFAALDGLPDVTEGLATDIAERTVLVGDGPAGVLGVVVVAVQGRDAHLVNLAVHPHAGGHGLGRKLIAAAEARARAAGARRMHLGTHAAFDHALDLYARLGWSETGRDGVKVSLSKAL